MTTEQIVKGNELHEQIERLLATLKRWESVDTDDCATPEIVIGGVSFEVIGVYALENIKKEQMRVLALTVSVLQKKLDQL